MAVYAHIILHDFTGLATVKELIAIAVRIKLPDFN